jgi:hypothetical protein
LASRSASDIDELLAVIGQLALTSLARLHVQARLGPQSRRGDFAGRRQQVRMEVARVAVRARRVHGKVDCHAITLRQLQRETARKRDACQRWQFRGQVDLELACHACVVALLGVLGGVPQPLAAARPLRRLRTRLCGQEDLGMQHVAPPAEVMQLARALITHPLPGAVGGGGGRAAPGAAADRADLQVEDRHRLRRRAGSSRAAIAGSRRS